MSPPDVGQLEEEYLVRALRSGWVAPLGPDVDALETEMASRVGVSHAVALSSGTAALHLGLLTLGVRPGDVVVTSTMTFAATANAITYVGAEPYFVDCDPVTGNLDPELLETAIRQLNARKESIGAIVPVDLLGKAVNYTLIEEIAARSNIPVLADAAESLGATHRGRPTGSFGRASVFSFNGNKIMTTSGGGMFLSNDKVLADRVRYFATQARQPAPHYEHTEIGYNYRMSNLLAALGRAQLSRLDEMIAKRRDTRRRYRALVADIPGVEIFGGDDDAEDNMWLTALLIDEEITGWSPVSLREALAAQDIESRPLWKPMHLQPVFSKSRGVINGSSESLFCRGITLPSGSSLTEAQLLRIESVISDFLKV